MEDLCYIIADLAMFMPEADLKGVDILKKWHDDPKSRVTELDEAVQRLTAYVEDRGDEMVDVEVYGPATEVGQREQKAQEQEEVQRSLGEQIGAPVRTVAQDNAFTMAHVVPEELVPEEEPSVSAPTLSGAAHAASYLKVTHLTDTLVRKGYLEDFQNGVYLQSDPLGTEIMGRRNKIAKHIKSKADAEEAVLALCREGKMELVNNGLFKIPHIEEDKIETLRPN
jgi:hypothetical protein